MMFVCLGNQGEKYQQTRHNAGRMFGRFLVDKFAVVDQIEKQEGKLWKLENNWQVVFLNCLMNNSGSCLKGFLKQIKQEANQQFFDDFYLVHDDLDLDLGEYKLQYNRGSAGHNGVKSVIEKLGTKKFNRVRIGIGRDKDIPSEKYVLMPFGQQQKKILKETCKQVLVELGQI